MDPRPDAVPAPSFWAGPAILVDDGPGDGAAAEAVPVLVLWSQGSAAAPDAPATGQASAPGLSELLERGFARLVAPAVAAVRALPRLNGAEVRLSADGAWFRILDGPDPLLAGELSAVSAQWRESVRAADLLAVLVATAPRAGRAPDEDADPAVRAGERMAAACAAGTLVGALLPVRVTTSEAA